MIVFLEAPFPSALDRSLGMCEPMFVGSVHQTKLVRIFECSPMLWYQNSLDFDVSACHVCHLLGALILNF
jgi:hypothetical protein